MNNPAENAALMPHFFFYKFVIHKTIKNQHFFLGKCVLMRAFSQQDNNLAQQLSYEIRVILFVP